MSGSDQKNIGQEIIAKAKELGADLAGIARVEDLKKSPSHIMSEKMPEFDNVATKVVKGRKPGIVEWPNGSRSAIVIALAHPAEKPELDWWVLGEKSTAGNTPGNKLLMETVSKLAEWLEKEKTITCFKLPYHIEHGGIYMKDAAVMAGLGCIGMNNILVTPEYGPRQRLRIMLINIDLPTSGPVEFDPCAECDVVCREACPVDAFSKTVYTGQEYGLEELPGRTGVYSRPLCSRQMDEDTANQKLTMEDDSETREKVTKFCRECEFSCPVGAS